MESLPKYPEGLNETPENAGEFDASLEKKSKRRRKTRIPLRKDVETETGKSEGEVSKKTGDVPGLFETKAETEDTADAEIHEERAAEDEPLLLPEVQESEDAGYSGELVIDHDSETSAEPIEAGGEENINVFEAILETEQAADSVENSVLSDERPHIGEVPVPEPIIFEPEPATVETPPPAVAPPLPFIVPGPSMPRAEIEAASLPPEPPEAVSSPRGRLSEEWAAVRRRSSVEDTVTETEASHRSYRSEKRGLSRGVVTGLLFGYMAGRRGKNALARDSEQALVKRDQTIQRLEKESKELRAEKADDKNILRFTKDKLEGFMQKARTDRPEVQATRVVERPVTVHSQETSSARRLFETPAIDTRKEFPEKKIGQKLPEEAPITAETYQAPEGRRVETSAWHRIEIDNRTGRAAEIQSVDYGEAFKHEQQQEKLARDAAKAQAAAQVGMTILSGRTVSDKTVPISQKQQISHPQLKQKQGIVLRDEAAQAVRQVAQGVTQPITWAAALVIVVLLFALGIL